MFKKLGVWIMQKIEKARRRRIEKVDYECTFWEDYDFNKLQCIPVKYSTGKGEHQTYNDAVIMFDTETSKKQGHTESYHNHVVVWSLAIMSYDHMLCCLWGDDPEDFISCINEIKKVLQGYYLFLYCHNLAYDYVFLRKFMFSSWGEPKKQLNTNPHYPIRITFKNGIQLRDSLILAQRSLEKWGKDLDVEHKKAVGQWDYEKIRNQHEKDNYTNEEIEYFCNDVLCGVECLNSTMRALNKKIYSMPYTATGIPREEVRSIAKLNRGHDRFLKREGGYHVLTLLEDCFHGGYCHANRHYLNETVKGNIQCRDFVSSYPYALLCVPGFPIEKFTPYDFGLSDILKSLDTYAFIFYLVLYNPILKNDDIPMPYLQNSKCKKTLDAVVDNGRILQATLVIIPCTEYDLQIIMQQYDFDIDKVKILDCHFAKKGYLPKWFRDYVYQLYYDKSALKNGDPVLYAIAKAKLNSLFGMCAQHVIMDEIEEDYKTGYYNRVRVSDPEASYHKYCKKFNSILNYQFGVYCTAIAAYNLMTFGTGALHGEDSIWLYSDTDSVYGIGFDEDFIKEYSDKCRENLKNAGYDPIVINDREFVLGIAELDGEYEEFRTCGAKRYACRYKDGDLKITVAGVPKKTGVKCLKDDINNFKPGLIFDGETTGKLEHKYFFIDEIYTDDQGNKTGDSIDLSPCDYLLSAESDFTFDELIKEYVEVPHYYE